ncbi:hypothetical protein KO02_10120 [Sphingobacterium sp. ML3W]|nr:hypothetical protein KO02_10120 [Sphingobacterium sp. ML3W]
MKLITKSIDMPREGSNLLLISRTRFRMARLFLAPLNLLIHKGFSSHRRGKTPLGRAMSHLLLNAVEGDYPNILVNPAKAKLSDGLLPTVTMRKVIREGAAVMLSWEKGHNPDLGASWDDVLIFCAYDIAGASAAINEEGVIRQDGRLTMELPSGLHGRPVHLFLVVHDRDGVVYSSSVYLGLF